MVFGRRKRENKPRGKWRNGKMWEKMDETEFYSTLFFLGFYSIGWNRAADLVIDVKST